MKEASLVNNLKRHTVCMVSGHRWTMIGYPAGADGEPSGTFLRCLKCAKEDHETGTVAGGSWGYMAGV